MIRFVFPAAMLFMPLYCRCHSDVTNSGGHVVVYAAILPLSAM
jgi:hypothetical protein